MFISYARADGRPFAERLHDALEARGTSAWYDQRDLDESQDFTAAIEDAIEDATHVVVCITTASKGRSSFVRREIEYAIFLKKPIVPVRVEQIPPHLHIATITWIDFFTGWDAAFAHLTKRLASPATNEEPSKAADEFRPHLERLSQFVIGEIRRTVLNVDAILDLRTTADDAQTLRTLPIAYQTRAPTWFDQRPTEPDERSFTSFAEAFEHHDHRVVLLGQPGAGKSTTLYAFARSAITERLADPQDLLPVFAPIRSWDGQTDLVTWLAGVTELAQEALLEELEGGRVLLLLDGLDELRGSGLSTSDNALRASFMGELQKLGGTPAVVTSRAAEWDELIQAAPAGLQAPATVRLLPIDDDRISAFLGDDADLRMALAADNELRELARNPLVLTLFALAYRDQGDAARELKNFASSPVEMRAQVFSRYIARRFEYEEARSADDAIPGFSLDELYEFLSECAVGLLDSFQRVTTESSRGRYSATESAGQTVDLVEVDVRSIRRAFGPPSLELIAFAERLQLLVPSHPRAVRFVHLLMRDFFAVPRAIDQLGRGDLVARRRAAGVLGLVADPRAFTPLVDAVVDEDPAVRTRVLWALGELRDPAAVGPIQGLLQGSKSSTARSSKLMSSPGAQTMAISGDDKAALAALTMTFGIRALARIGGDDAQRAIEDLSPLLSNQDPLARMEWMSALARFGASGVPPLAWALENDFFASWAAEALGEIGDGSATATLIGALDNENISEEVQEALGSIGDAKAVPALASLLGRKWSEEAVGALARIGGPDAVHALVELMADPDPSHRSMVAFALGRTHPPDGVPRLIEATKDPDIRVRCAAADALDELDYDTATVERLRPTSTDLIEMLRDADANVRAAAAQLLGVRREQDVADALTTVLGDPETDVRKAALMSLARLGDPRVVGPLSELLFSDESELAGVDGSIAWALGAVGMPEAVYELIHALDESEDRQDTVVEGLVRSGPAAVAPLASILESADQAFQVSIARVLLAIGQAAIEESVRLLGTPARTMAAEILMGLGEEAEQVVIARLTSAAAPEREAAALVLRGIGTARSVEPLLSLLADANTDVRAAATDALIAIGELSIDHLFGALSNEDPQARAAAARALGQIGLHRAIDVLIAALDDPDPGVRLQALLAMAEVARFVPEDRVPRLLDDPDVVVRRMTHTLLDTARDAEITPAETQELVEALGHANRELAWVAGNMLVGAGDLASLANALVGPDELARDASHGVLIGADPEAVAPLAALQKGASRELRTAIIRILASHGDRKAIKVLVSSLNEDSLAPGDMAASILVDVADASVPVLVGRMADATFGPVYVELIGRTGAVAIDLLIAQLTGDDVETQAIAADLLSRMGRPAVGPLIEVVGRGDDLEPRMLAIEALSKHDHPRAAAALAAVADAPASDSAWLYPIEMRLAAVEALSRSKSAIAASGLRHASVSPERRVRSSAAKSVRARADGRLAHPRRSKNDATKG